MSCRSRWTILVLGMLTAVLITSGCTAKPEGFAIYLTKQDVPPAQLRSLSQVEIAEEPVISPEEVVTYNSQTHELKVTEAAFKRICDMQVPVAGKSFVCCVDRKPVYSGAFWTPISSISFEGVTIWKPYGAGKPEVLTLELGYPSADFYGGTDPRNMPSILRALERDGKLITKLSITAVSALPHAMKGYELYSWPEGTDWHFTLITGTNRNKTAEEIMSREDFVSEAGFLKVSVTGTEAIKAALGKLPEKESVTWLADMREPSQNPSVIRLPPASISNEIREFAEQRGLDFYLHTP